MDINHRWWDRFALANLRWYHRQFDGLGDNVAISGRARPIGLDQEEFFLLDDRTIEGPADEYGKVLREPRVPLWRLVVTREADGFLVAESGRADGKDPV